MFTKICSQSWIYSTAGTCVWTKPIPYTWRQNLNFFQVPRQIQKAEKQPNAKKREMIVHKFKSHKNVAYLHINSLLDSICIELWPPQGSPCTKECKGMQKCKDRSKKWASNFMYLHLLIAFYWSVNIFFLARLVSIHYSSAVFYIQTPILTQLISMCWLNYSPVNTFKIMTFCHRP